LPEVPQRVKEIDQELARLWTSYQLGREQIEQQPIAMPLIVGQQAALQRQYEIKRQGLLLEREALMGDYDRATRRAEMILDLEKEQRQEERENQRLAIQIMSQWASADEQIMLNAYEQALNRQEKLEDRLYQEQRDNYRDILQVAASNPLEFSRAVAKYGFPKTPEEAIRMIGEFKVAKPEYAPPTSYREWVLAGKPGAREYGEEEGFRKWLEERRRKPSLLEMLFGFGAGEEEPEKGEPNIFQQLKDIADITVCEETGGTWNPETGTCER